MVQLILGGKGKGKTTHLLARANQEILKANGSIVYLDKNSKHMYELNNKIRLINVTDYEILDSSEFIGFIHGIISQDHDLEQMYFDSFLTIGHVEGNADDIGGKLEEMIARLERVSNRYGVDFILSCAVDEKEVAASLGSKIIVSL